MTAPNIPELANRVDALYGRITNPDTGVVAMPDNGVEDVVIGSMDAFQFVLPATHWVTHMPTGLLWVSKDSVPQGTIDALKRRQLVATRIYLFGGPDQISAGVVRQLSQYGVVMHERRRGRIQRPAAGHCGGDGDRVLEDVGWDR